MAFSTQPLSFKDVKGVMDKALAAEHGVKVKCSSYGAAMKLRHRMNAARTRDRIENKKVYPEEHPMYGCSPYDQLVMRIERNSPFLIVQKVTEDTIETATLTAEDIQKLSGGPL